MLWMRHYWLGTLCLLVSACTAVPPASVDSDREGKTFRQSTDQAVVYIYRETIIASRVPVAVGVGRDHIGNLGADTWMRVELDPAQYPIRCVSKENTNTVVVDLAAGEVRFIEVAMRAGWHSPRCAIFETSHESGRAAVAAGRRVNAAAVTVPTQSPAGPVLLIYRDDQSNERRISLVIRYEALLGRSRVVPFTIENMNQEKACSGSFTAHGPRDGRFTLSCGFLEGQGTYQIARDGPKDQFVARGQSKTGNPMMLVVGRPSGVPSRL